MILVDGAYLYGLGLSIQPLHTINQKGTYGQVWYNCYVAKNYLEGFITDSDYSDAVRIMVEPANSLIFALETICEEAIKPEKKDKILDPTLFYNLRTVLRDFESVFKAEFRHGNLFLATQKGAYDLRTLFAKGELLFPANFTELFPEAVKDVQDGARCLVFEMYTASGFHFHRANESVLLRYLKSVRAKQPDNRNMGAYIEALKDVENVPKEIIVYLKSLKDLQRNPLMHPGESIDNVDDALALLNAVHTAITAMMREIASQHD